MTWWENAHILFSERKLQGNTWRYFSRWDDWIVAVILPLLFCFRLRTSAVLYTVWAVYDEWINGNATKVHGIRFYINRHPVEKIPQRVFSSLGNQTRFYGIRQRILSDTLIFKSEITATVYYVFIMTRVIFYNWIDTYIIILNDKWSFLWIEFFYLFIAVVFARCCSSVGFIRELVCVEVDLRKKLHADKVAWLCDEN